MPTKTVSKARRDLAAGVPASRLIDRYIAEKADWRGQRLARIRKLLHDADPAIVEEWKWMGSPVFSHDGIVCVVNAHKEKVKLTFHHGAKLPDPKQLFNNGLDGGQWRSIDLAADDELDEAAFKKLVLAAVEHNAKKK